MNGSLYWLEWFECLSSKDVVRKRVFRPGQLIHGLDAMTSETAAIKLEAAFSDIFVPGPQHLDILMGWIDHAKAHAYAVFPSVKDYNLTRYCAKDMKLPEYPIRCLTGLGGVSKSSLCAAFTRLCELPEPGEFRCETQRIRVYPVRRLSIDVKKKEMEILQSLSNPLASGSRCRGTISNVKEHIKDWFMATATCSLIVDEMQFVTQSSAANTLTSQLIFSLMSLGPPLIYVANYSLVEKLDRRPHEEKDRLLGMPTVLQPPGSNDDWWHDAIREYVEVAPDIFQLNPFEHADLLHQYTAGLFRQLKRLLIASYKIARANGKATVDLDTVREAYRSREYAIYRQTTEDLRALDINPSVAKRRPDLICPLNVLPSPAQAIPLKKKQTTTFQDIPNALLESTLSPAARKYVQQIRQESIPNEVSSHSNKVVPIKKRPSLSAQSLQVGAQLLRDGVLTSTTRKKSVGD